MILLVLYQYAIISGYMESDIAFGYILVYTYLKYT